jgi:glyoxylase I family protein
VVLRVRDQAASQAFYTRVLGLRLDHVNEAARLVQLRAGRHLIDLLPLPPGEAADAAARMDHVCLSVRCEDLGRAAAWLRAQGVAIEGDVVSRRGAFGQGGSLYIRDPDGFRIELKPRGGPHS